MVGYTGRDLFCSAGIPSTMAELIRRTSLKYGSAIIADAGALITPEKGTPPLVSITTPGSLEKIETQVVDAAAVTGRTTRVTIRYPTVENLGQSWLRVTLAAPGGAPGGYIVPGVGFRVIKSLRVLFGSNVLAEYGDYEQALKLAMSYLEPAIFKSVWSGLGHVLSPVFDSSLDVAIPLLVPGAGILSSGAKDQTFLPLSRATPGSALTLEVTFNDNTHFYDSVPHITASPNAISACSLVLVHASFLDSSAIEASAGAVPKYWFRDYQTLPSHTNLAAGFVNDSFDLTALSGTIESLHVFATQHPGGFDGGVPGTYLNVASATVNEVRIDGRTYWSSTATSSAERFLEAGLFSGGAVDEQDIIGTGHAITIPFSLFAAEPIYSGGLCLSDIRNFQLVFSSPDATQYTVAAASRAYLTLEGGRFVRIRP